MENMFNSDPLLGRTPTNTSRFDGIDEQITQKLEQLKNLQQASRMQQEQSKTPIWDEIDGLMAGLSEKEIEYISNIEDFQQSNNKVMGILNREYLRVMRPIVEGTKDGKEALEAHLSLVKRLKKNAADEVNKKYALLDEYMEKGGDMTFNEFVKLKKKAKK
jgi:hypothetical protein